MRYVVFDVETKNTFEDVGKNDPVLLDVSVVSVYDSGTDTYTTVSEEAFDSLWPVFEHADVLVGYNSNHFDIPLLDKYYPGSLLAIKSIDLLEAIRTGLGRRVSLNAVAEATLGEQKTGHGLQAITWWKQGEIEKIKEYCEMDVAITKRIFEYAQKHKKVRVREGLAMRNIPIDTTDWDAENRGALTHALPF